VEIDKFTDFLYSSPIIRSDKHPQDRDIIDLMKKGHKITFNPLLKGRVEIYSEINHKGVWHTIIGAGINVEDAWQTFKNSVFRFEKSRKTNRRNLMVVK